MKRFLFGFRFSFRLGFNFSFGFSFSCGGLVLDQVGLVFVLVLVVGIVFVYFLDQVFV
jgi:hypothetical protein